jgi:hypothetical protein
VVLGRVESSGRKLSVRVKLAGSLALQGLLLLLLLLLLLVAMRPR